MKVRTHDPLLGIFLQMDPLAEKIPGVNWESAPIYYDIFVNAVNKIIKKYGQ